ncbi:trace amine-associated receptor 7a-like [Protopterus annectens]|uniref:trace amine-associated receptor 7a-like n=1 Tax=Protopterus annectens TaxID=7888 RepID=UPI001CFB7506|nr:trace amine-associated receptor 7a-like [Protopterus annectens]
MDSSYIKMEILEQCFENINGSCSRTPRRFAEQTALYITLILGDALCISGNLMVIISISYFKQLHSPTHFLVLSLAFADFLIGVLVLPFSIIRAVESCWYFGDTFCLFHSSVDAACSLSSIFHLCFISIERYFAVSNPLTYHLKFTTSVLNLLICLGWLLPITYALAMPYSNTYADELQDFMAVLPCKGSCQMQFNNLWAVINLLIYLIPFSLMIGMYTNVFIIARRQARLIESIAGKTATVKEYSSEVAKRERKAAKTLGIAVGAFTICWMPLMLDVTVDTIFNVTTPLTVYQTFFWIAYFNSSLNPLIYAFFFPWFRETVKLIVTCKIIRFDYSDRNLFNE